MTLSHALRSSRRDPRPDTLGPTASRIIEVGEIAAGIAVPERDGVRFFSSSRNFDRLDGALFRSVAQAARAARDRSRR